MSLANPWGLLAAGLAVPLVVWYVLRSRRPRTTVASTFLWRDVERTTAAAIPWQRFRPDVTFWLVLLAILAGALALAQPYVPVATTLGDHTVLIMDTSGSMLTDEDGPSRLELARREATSLVDRIGPGQRLSVVEAGSRARVLLTRSDDPGAARDALSSLELDHGVADLTDAFTLATALEQPGESFVTLLFTDTEVPPGDIKSAPAGLTVVPIGTPRPNLAVTRLQAVGAADGTSQVFVQVRNFGQLEVDADLSLAVGDTVVIEERFRMPPRGTEDRVLSVTGDAGDVLSARVSPVGNDVTTGQPSTDRLSIDDQALTLLAGSADLTVVLVTPGNVFLEAALDAVAGGEVEVLAEVPASLDDVDLLVVDRLPVPANLVVPTLLVSPTTLPDGLDRGAEVEQPTLTFQATGDELLTEVDLSDTAIAVGTPLVGATVGAVAGGPAGDLIVAGRLSGVPVVALGFDLLQSNLPLLPAWPVFVNNVATTLTGPGSTVGVFAGQTVTVPVPPGATSLEVAPPGGDPRPLDLTSPRVTVDTVGLWRLSWEGQGLDGATPAIAVNADAVESDTVANPPIAGQLVAANDPGAEVATDEREGRRSILTWVLGAVLFAVLAEWMYAHLRRPTPRSARTSAGGTRSRLRSASTSAGGTRSRLRSARTSAGGTRREEVDA